MTLNTGDKKQGVEKEIKFSVKDIISTLGSIRKIAKFSNTEYIKDTIYGCDNDNRKIRLRLKDDFKNLLISAIYKYKIKPEHNDIKTEIEEFIYEGNNIEDALAEIKKLGDFKEENSYEKIRTLYINDKTEITLDVYPYGAWVEIEGDPKDICEVAKKIGFDKEKATVLNADELYLEWNKKMGLEELWHVAFGLNENKPNK